MAALCPGVQYGLSSYQNFGENKDLIFVKLTDSALRAIEEYLKNQNKFNILSPTIQFLGNENGELSFPQSDSSRRPSTFSFSVSSTGDMEGPGGSFECVRQRGTGGTVGAPHHLDSLGGIPYKVRVHANDDVYEATRNRMTEAEDKYKNKCTREIKPNQTDIGRKVKLKHSLAHRNLLPVGARREPQPNTMPSMRESLLKQPATAGVVSPLPRPSQLSQATPTSTSQPQPPLSNGLGSNHVSSSRPPNLQTAATNRKPSGPDVTRRPLRERLIQLLAIKPYKKVELHDRLMKEGIRDRKSMMTVLNAISHMKDNCFHLNSTVWDEVNEDWPFYTDAERQMVRRRRPQTQNRTPPGGSDGGSASSGQSPTSTHPGSPPLAVVPNNKRLANAGQESPFSPYKKQRIAHVGNGRPVDPIYRQPTENNSQRRPVTDLRDASNMNPRSRESPNSYFGGGGANAYGTATPNDVLEDSASSHRKQPMRQQHEGSPVPKARATPPPPSLTTEEAKKEIERRSNRDRSSHRNNSSTYHSSGILVNSNTLNSNNHRVTSSSQPVVARVSPDSSQAELPPVTASPEIIEVDKPVEEDDEEDFPDFQKLYVPINSPEQRRKYKADFNADYAEYRRLFGIVERVSKKFAQLEERLKQEDENSPSYKNLKKQIVREYQESKRDIEQQRAKRRFQYLHDKLSHIKGLVTEYDSSGGKSRAAHQHRSACRAY